jgi:Helix-hairpin-helix motif
VTVGSRKGWWVLASLIPFGLGTWGGFAYAGAQARVARWKVYAVVYGVLSWGAFIVTGVTSGDDDNTLQGFLILVPWIVGIVHSFVARPEYVRRVGSPPSALEVARTRLEQRDEALRIARENPRLAIEAGIGRPDRKGGMDAGLVDVNSAPVWALEHLPGVDGKLAKRIVAVREELDGFDSLEDFGMTLDLPGDVVEDMRGTAIFLPR